MKFRALLRIHGDVAFPLRVFAPRLLALCAHQEVPVCDAVDGGRSGRDRHARIDEGDPPLRRSVVVVVDTKA